MIFCDVVIVGGYTADLIGADQVIVDLEMVAALGNMHIPKCGNYVLATGKNLCLMINCGMTKVEMRQITAQA